MHIYNIHVFYCFGLILSRPKFLTVESMFLVTYSLPPWTIILHVLYIPYVGPCWSGLMCRNHSATCSHLQLQISVAPQIECVPTTSHWHVELQLHTCLHHWPLYFGHVSHDLVRCCKSTSFLKTDFPSFCFAVETFLILPLLYFLPVTNEMINVGSLLRYLSIHFSVFLVESAKEHLSGRCLARLGQLYWHYFCFVSLPAVGRFLSCNK